MALCQIKNIVLSDAFIVYNVDTKHGFAEIEKHMDKLKNLAGPVYDIESAHHFNGLTERMETLKNLKGPVYHIENQHHFNEFEKQVKGNPIGAYLYFFSASLSLRSQLQVSSTDSW